MKNYLKKWYFVAICFILAMLLCCLSGCSSTGATIEEPTQNLNVKYYYKAPTMHLFTVEIEGHLYIIYSGTYAGNIIHAEHCPCKMK